VTEPGNRLVRLAQPEQDLNPQRDPAGDVEHRLRVHRVRQARRSDQMSASVEGLDTRHDRDDAATRLRQGRDRVRELASQRRPARPIGQPVRDRTIARRSLERKDACRTQRIQPTTKWAERDLRLRRNLRLAGGPLGLRCGSGHPPQLLSVLFDGGTAVRARTALALGCAPPPDREACERALLLRFRNPHQG